MAVPGLSALRRQAGWRQRDLAGTVGATQLTVGDWENGRTRPSAEFQEALVRALAGRLGWSAAAVAERLRDRTGLRALRLAAGFSQRGLAAAAGVSPSEVGMFERGEHRPTPWALRRLAAPLELSPAEFAARLGEPDPTPVPAARWTPPQAGAALAGWRRWHGERHVDLAADAGLPASTVGAVERGDRQPPVALLRAAAARYRLDVRAALVGSGHPDPPPPQAWPPGTFTALWPDLRALAELTLADVAAAVGISRAAVGYWSERGAEPTDSHLAPLGALLAARLAWHPTFARAGPSELAAAIGYSRRRGPHPGAGRR